VVNLSLRRTLLKLLVGSASLQRWSCAHAEPKDDRPTPELVSQWMTAWMTGARLPDGTLHLFRFSNPMYALTKPITWKPNSGQKPTEVTVPEGFVTDFASIPRVFWSLLRPDGQYTYPAIVHDYLYWIQDRPREEADLILKYGMEDFNVSGVAVSAIYAAVRVGGASAWDNNGRLRRDGERRILQRFPDDPCITWDEWKNVEGVFR